MDQRAERQSPRPLFIWKGQRSVMPGIDRPGQPAQIVTLVHDRLVGQQRGSRLTRASLQRHVDRQPKPTTILRLSALDLGPIAIGGLSMRRQTLSDVRLAVLTECGTEPVAAQRPQHRRRVVFERFFRPRRNGVRANRGFRFREERNRTEHSTGTCHSKLDIPRLKQE
jgi:hypothetical protein